MLLAFNRFDYCEGTALFWSEYHSGQFSRGYAILSRILSRFSPGPMDMVWETMEDGAKNVYRAWCQKEGETCEYDTVRYILQQSGHFDLGCPCVEYFLERYGNENTDETGLINYQQSDFVNLDMPYTSSLLQFYSENETAVLAIVDELCDAAGYCSRLHLLEGQTIETPDDFATALVNAAMTYLGGEIWRTIEDARS